MSSESDNSDDCSVVEVEINERRASFIGLQADPDAYEDAATVVVENILKDSRPEDEKFLDRFDEYLNSIHTPRNKRPDNIVDFRDFVHDQSLIDCTCLELPHHS